MTEYLPVTSEMLVQCAVKSTVILAVAGLLSVSLFRRASAATRHLVWTMAFVAVLALPVLSLRLPGWHVLPAWTAPQSTMVQAPARAQGSAVEPQAGVSTVLPGPAPTRAGGLPESAGSAGATPAMVAAEPAGPVPTVPEMAAASGRFGSIGLGMILLGVWGAGALVALIPTLLAPFLLRRLRRRAVPLREASWMGLLAELRGELQVRRRVALLQGRTTVPASFGIFVPTILVPAGGDKPGEGGRVWPAERRRIVLLHELAHIKRHDHLTLLVAQIACAVYWFHPLAWVAARRLHVERERACDDLVLGAGVEAPAYARMLLRIVQGFTRAAAPRAALHMATPSTLEQRVRAILAPGQNRRRMPVVSAALFVAMSAGALVPLAMVRAQSSGPDWPGLARRLASNEYAAREAAQKELGRIPPDQFATLKSFAETQTDPEVRSRLQKRLEEMEVYHLLHPQPISVHLQDAGIDAVVKALNKQLGGQDFILTPDQMNANYIRNGGTGMSPPLAEAKFTIEAASEPFWEVARQLADQHPFGLVDARPPQLHLEEQAPIDYSAGAVWDYSACDGFLLHAFSVNFANFNVTYQGRTTKLGAFDKWPEAPNPVGVPPDRDARSKTCAIVFRAHADPRIRIHQTSPALHITEIIDDQGCNLLPAVLSLDDALIPAPTQGTLRGFSALVRLPVEHEKLASLKGTMHVSLIAEESDLVIDHLDLNGKMNLPMVGGSLSFAVRPDSNGVLSDSAGSVSPRFMPMENAPGNLRPAVVYVDFVDARGRIVFSIDAGEQKNWSFGLATFPDGLKIRVRQALRIVDARVPFELKNVALPEVGSGVP